MARGWGREAASWLAELARWEAPRGGPGVGGVGGLGWRGGAGARERERGCLGAAVRGRQAGRQARARMRGDEGGEEWAGARVSQVEEGGLVRARAQR